MQRKIKKLSITVEKGGLMCPLPGAPVKQKLTIKNNGQIWFTTWRNLTMDEECEGMEGMVKVSEYKKLMSLHVDFILEEAQKVLPKYIDKEYKIYIMDACPDEAIIEYEDGEIVFGQLANLTYELDEVEDFYEFLAKETCIDDLFFLDERILDNEDDD